MNTDTTLSTEDFLASITDAQRQQDCRDLVTLMKEATGTEPKMWGQIVGFGKNHYVYETGREGDTVAVGFASRKAAIVLYCVYWYGEPTDKLEQLGKFKLGKGCMYIKKLADVDSGILKEIVAAAYTARHNA
jgi:hypothetical protein